METKNSLINTNFPEEKFAESGPVVNCFLKECIYCKDDRCTNTEITLDEEHACTGGCDDGWVFRDEEDDEGDTNAWDKEEDTCYKASRKTLETLYERYIDLYQEFKANKMPDPGEEMLVKKEFIKTLMHGKHDCIRSHKQEEKVLYLFLGRSGVGKSALAKAFCEEYGLRQVRSYATRPQRPGEEIHADHIFICRDQVEEFRDDMAAYTKIGDYEYFTTWDQLMKCDVYVIDPVGYYDLRDKIAESGKRIRLVPVYVTVPESIRKERALARGDAADVYQKRAECEDAQFTAFESDIDKIEELIVLENTGSMEDAIWRLRNTIDRGKKS